MADNKVNLLVSLKDQASSGLGKITNKLGAFGKALTPVTVAVAALGAAIIKLGFDAAKAGDDFAKMGKQVGVTAETLSELAFAAQIGGTDVNSVATALRIVSKRVNDANRGLITSVEAFQQAGIEIRKTNGEFKSAEELIMDSADAFAAMENATERTALAMELFGRSGGKLVPVLIEGSDEIRKLRNEARTLGITFTDLEAKQAEQMTDAFLRLTSVFKGMGLAIGKQIMPILTQLFTILKDALLPLIPLVRNTFRFLLLTFEAIAKPLIIIVDLFVMLANALRRIKNFGKDVRNFFIKLFNEDIPSAEELEKRRNAMGAFFGEIENGAKSAEASLEFFRTQGVIPEGATDEVGAAEAALSRFKQSSDQAAKGIQEGFGNTMRENFSSVFDVVKKSGEDMADVVVTAVDDIGLAMADALLEGESFKEGIKSVFKSMAKAIVQQVAIMIARLVALQVVMAATGMSAGGLFGIGAGSGGGIIGSITGAVSGLTKGVKKVFGFADGGRPPVNQVSVVGERGAELFVPDQAGTIIPNEALGGTQSIGVVNIMPYATIDKALTDKPMSFWVDLAQTKILPALNNLGKSGQTTTLNFRGAR